MNNLISVDEFVSYRQISKKVNEDKVNECISLAQQGDFANSLGDLYFDVLKNKDEASYVLLMDGGDFKVDGGDFAHSGLKRYLADLAYSRFVYVINANFTPFGMQMKNSENSQGVDRNFIRDQSKQAQIDASSKFKFIQKYIESERVLFKRFFDSSENTGSFATLKTSKL